MLTEHNPIAELISQIQKKWMEEASPFPELKLVRWMIKPDQARLYEGFLRLESTEHGSIPEVLIAMLTPFTNDREYSKHLINGWIQAYKDDKKTQDKLTAKGAESTWSPDRFLSQSSVEKTDHNQLFLEMLMSFHQAMVDKNRRLVVALFPHTIHSMEGFRNWLLTLMKLKLPYEITFMIFNHIGDYQLDKVFENFPELTKSLYINLDLDGAVKKITKMGDPNSPEVKFRECILEMSEAVQKKDKTRLDNWGKKALDITQRSGLKSMYASAHIIYAGMLFNFKEFYDIDSLLNKGLHITKQGLKTEEASCRPLMIQFYGYTGASKQLQKRTKEAIAAYEQQGDLAVDYQLPAMSLTPYWQAYTLSKKSIPERYGDLIQKAFAAGKSMQKEEQAGSNFLTIALDYIKWQQANHRWEEATQTDEELKQIAGANWKETVKNPETSYAAHPQEAVAV